MGFDKLNDHAYSISRKKFNYEGFPRFKEGSFNLFFFKLFIIVLCCVMVNDMALGY